MKKLIAVFTLTILWPLAGSPAAEIPADGLDLPVISEFAAVNDKGFSTLVEGEETRSDWIEIHNPSSQSLNLDGWYLTDDPDNLTLWRFPEVHLESGGNLIVWASDVQAEDHPENWPYLDESGYCHTNFKLDRAGDYLALVSPDLQVVHEYAGLEISKDVWGFPPQAEGISYGLCNGQQAFLPIPTPGLTNAPVCIEQCEEPVFSHDSGTFVNSFVLALNCPTPNAEIYYTLDGTEPVQKKGRGVASAKYNGPMLINGSVEVMVRAYHPDMEPSTLVGRSYLALSNTVTSFSSNLPIIIVDTGRQSVRTSGFTPVNAAFIDIGVRGRANITDVADYIGRGGLRNRGSSSQGFAKKQYAFETWDLDNEDKDVSIWGFPAESDWILYGPAQYDRVLISNALAYELSNQAGRYAVRTRFCEMYLNSNDKMISDNDYIGLYIFMEKISRDAERVAVEKLNPWDSTEPRVSGGYALSIDRAGDGTFSTSRGRSLNYVYPKGEDITRKQTDWIKGYFNRFESALYGNDFTNPQTGYARYIDVDSFVDHHLLNLLPLNVDAFRLSGYMFKKRGGKLELGPIWDFDRALNSTDSRDDRADSWSGNGGTNFLTYGWFAQLFQDPHFWMKFIDRWFDLRSSVFSQENLYATIDSMVEEIGEAQPRNTQRWSQFGPRYGSFAGEVVALKDWLDVRASWIDSQFIRPPVFSQAPSQQGTELLVSLDNPNGAGNIYYTLDGPNPWVSEKPRAPIPPTVLMKESNPKRVFVPTEPISDAWRDTPEFDDSAWKAARRGSGGVGYELARNGAYDSLISLDLESQMFDISSSCYIRIPFTLSEDISTYTDVILQIRYDDGFIAYLNGAEVARAGFSGDPQWNSHAGSSHSNSSAQTLKDFAVADFGDLLIQGRNLLTIHGLNRSAADSDFLISVQLVAHERSSQPLPTAMEDFLEYTGPITLTHSTLIKARVRQDSHLYSHWGGLAQQVFLVGPVVDNLRISEIMYHPADTGSPLDPNAEYIELTNIGDQAINLNRVRFTKGIDFLFPDVVLAPQDYVLVVKDVDAFTATYDTTRAVVIGAYAGSLSNGGERIELVDAGAEEIQSLQYKDKWHDLTDGLGFSLTLIDPADPQAVDASDKDLWRSSMAPGGSPGWDDSH